jgi:hypothetical protein
VDTPFTYRSPPLATISSAPPPYRSSIEASSVQSHAPYRSPSISQPHSFSPNLKRTSDAAFGDVNGECGGVDTSLASPALTVEGSHSHQQSESDPVKKGPPSSSSYQQQGESPLSIWPSAFTIPSKIIKNTRKNRRTWSRCPNTCSGSVLTLGDSLAGAMVNLVIHITTDAHAGR